MERTNGNRKAETKSVLDGIHALYIRGKITLEQHNEMCHQACEGATAFEL